MHEKKHASTEEQSLPLHEWLVVLAIFFILLTLTFLSLFNDVPKTLNDQTHFLVSQEITVVIEGAVAKPGTYTVKRGSLVEDALKLAEPLPTADLKKIKINKKLRNNQKIKVHQQKSRSTKRKNLKKNNGNIKHLMHE